MLPENSAAPTISTLKSVPWTVEIVPELTTLPRKVPSLLAMNEAENSATEVPFGELIAPVLMMFPAKVPPLPMARP